ncbi:MAG: succinylglutamate desuccinylase/aspartoacylase family protein [Alphaproteobacteria bacterium]|nr:succinylglutamate desuccinylase/aspartoacylase family protein [Alphaproteobacteria bacterium]MCB9930484.1 succinylglutamate desuccinylase/aspartoacylase family protein [Alphaproteobacteria bacterium]
MTFDTPIEFAWPDIRRYADGNTGIPYVWRFDSGQPGRHVMVNAVTHGNELCGAVAVDLLFKLRIRPKRGRLTLGFANHAAYNRFDPQNPWATRQVEENFNRLWVEERLDGPEDSLELRRAREMRPVFDAVDDLLDIHSMSTESPPLTLFWGNAKEQDAYRRTGYPAHGIGGPVHDPGKRIIEYTPFNDTGNDKTAQLVECGQHWADYTRKAAIDTAFRFLVAMGTIDAADAAPHLHDRNPPAPRVLEVTHGIAAKTDRFAFAAPYKGLETIAAAGTVIAHDGDAPVATPYDDCVLVMPNHRAGKGQRVLRLARPV